MDQNLDKNNGHAKKTQMPAPKSRAKRKNVPTSIRGGTIKVETAVREMTITVAGPIKPADTAVWPITRAPTMLTACPKERGILILASLKISKMIITSSASSTAGKGVPSLAEVMEIKRCGDQFLVKTAQRHKKRW